jgi:hypothetical protein
LTDTHGFTAEGMMLDASLACFVMMVPLVALYSYEQSQKQCFEKDLHYSV